MPTLPFISTLLARADWSTDVMVLLLKATLVLVVAFGLTQTLQRASAGTRHLVWLVALVGLLAVPVLTAWAPLEIPILPALARSNATPAPTVVRTNVPVTRRTPELSSSDRADPAPLVRTPDRTVAAPAPRDVAPWTGWVVEGAFLVLAIWVSGVVIVLLGLAWSGLAVHRILRRAHTPADPAWRKVLVEAADRLGLDEPPRLLVSADTHMPFGCGVLAPTIVIPEESDAWSVSRRRAVLLHELAHVRRRDLLAHMLGRITCACYWFHPLVWVAAKQLRCESERACDDLAVTCGTVAADYAEHLLDIVTAVRARSVPTVALAMARRKEFEGRVLAILDPELPHSSPRRATSVALIATVGLSAGLVAAAAPVPRSHATTVQQPPTSTPSAPPAQVQSRPAQQVAAVPIPRPTHAARVTSEPSASSASLNLSANALAHQILSTLRTQATTVVTGRETQTANAQEPPDDRPVLLAKVLRTDSSASLRRVAAWGLQQYDKSSVAADALVNAVRHDADAGVREMAAWSLQSYDDQRSVVDALSAALRGDADSRVRATAAWALGGLNADAAADALAAALSDSNESVRTRAAWALGNAQVKQAPPALIAMLRDRDTETRQLAAWALYQIQDPAALPALETALHSESNEDVQLAYLRAIAVMGDKSVDVLRGLLESPDKRIKSMAVHALAGGHASGPWPWPWPEPRPDPES
jgi:beta-lactamase regulating signal transducer with metallopeptidase domain/HEAT repeat protein